MRGICLGSTSGERVEFAVRRFVHVEARNVRCNLVLIAFIRGDQQVKQVAFLSEMVRGRIPRRNRNRLHSLWGRILMWRQQSREHCWGLEIVSCHRVRSGRRTSKLCGRNGIMKRQARQNSVQGICSVSSSSNEFPHSNDMQSCLFLIVWVFHQLDFGFRCKVFNLWDLDEVVYSFSLVFEMEAWVLKGTRRFDDRLANVMDCLLRGDLWW